MIPSVPCTPNTDLARFAEADFPAKPPWTERYAKSVTDGYRTMRQKRIAITGLARDIAAVLPRTIARIERLGSLFADYRVVLYENDSRDDTLSQLRTWATANPRVTIISEHRNDPVNPTSRCLSRVTRMAYYRAACWSRVTQDHADCDAVVVLDTDLHGGWSYDGVANTFARGDWDFVGANGIIYRRNYLRPNVTVQYDAWAFRTDDHYRPWTTRDVNNLTFRRGEPWEQVTSCFGGFGVYQFAAYQAGVYTGDDIEHVTFHRSMCRAGYSRLFLNPSLIALYGRKHRTLDPYVRRAHLLCSRLVGRHIEWKAVDDGHAPSRAA